MQQVVASPEQNLRFLEGVADFTAQEFLLHQSKRVVSLGDVALADLEGQEIDEVTKTLKGVGYAWNFNDTLTPDVVSRIIEETREVPLAKHPAVLDDARKKYGPKVVTANVLVENGHPGYVMLIHKVFSMQKDAWKWGKGWIADEYWHGPSIQEWGKYAGYLDLSAIHQDTQGYQRHGLTLDFPTSAHGFSYPALQEPATVLTHREAMRLLPKGGESYAASIGRHILGMVVADEKGHEEFYANMVRHALESGDKEITSMQMLALADALIGFAMPGMESDIPNRSRLMLAYSRSGAFTLPNLAQKVLLPSIDGLGIYGWDVANKTELTSEAAEAQADIIDFGEKLKAAGDDQEKISIEIVEGRKKYGLVA